MSDPLTNVQQGDSPAALFRADRFNIVNDAARDFLNRKLGRPTGAAFPFAGPDPHLTCYARYAAASIETLDEFSVVAYSTLKTPLSDAKRHKTARKPVFDGATPADADDPFLVTLEPIKGQEIGLAVCVGLVPVRVLVNDAGHTRAAPVVGETGHLETVATGGVPLVHVDDVADPPASPDVRWGIVLLPSGGSGAGGSGGGEVSTTDCAGCGWLTAMTTSYCVRFTQHSPAGACDCSDTAGQTSLGTYNGVQTKWLGATNFTICGADYTPKFWYTTTADGQLAPQLTLTAAVGGAVYTARFLCCYGCCAKFALYDATVCDGTFDHLTGPCGNVVYYTVCWHTCATCTDCPDATVPNVMAFAFGTDGTGDLACLNGAAGEMVWSPGTLWTLNPVTLCGNSGLVSFGCPSGSVSFSGQFANPPGNLTGALTATDCETLTYTFTVTSDSASGSITVVITPAT